jgi:hypothetical protein
VLQHIFSFLFRGWATARDHFLELLTLSDPFLIDVLASLSNRLLPPPQRDALSTESKDAERCGLRSSVMRPIDQKAIGNRMEDVIC